MADAFATIEAEVYNEFLVHAVGEGMK